MTRGPSKLRKTIEPDVDHVWNGSGTIEDSADSLESQIDNRRTALINNNRELGMVGLHWDLDMRLAKNCQIHRYRLDDRQPSLQPCHQYWSEYWLDGERLPSVCHQVSQQSSSPWNENEDDWQDALRSAPSEATRKRRQERIRISVVLEPEAGG